MKLFLALPGVFGDPIYSPHQGLTKACEAPKGTVGGDWVLFLVFFGFLGTRQLSHEAGISSTSPAALVPHHLREARDVFQQGKFCVVACSNCMYSFSDGTSSFLIYPDGTPSTPKHSVKHGGI